jgi:hypothetical protein
MRYIHVPCESSVPLYSLHVSVDPVVKFGFYIQVHVLSFYLHSIPAPVYLEVQFGSYVQVHMSKCWLHLLGCASK